MEISSSVDKDISVEGYFLNWYYSSKREILSHLEYLWILLVQTTKQTFIKQTYYICFKFFPGQNYFLFIFNWPITALQYCVGFCHTSTWINHRYTCVPSLLNLPPSTPSHPARLSDSTDLSSPGQNSRQAVYGTEFWSFNSSIGFMQLKSPKLVLKENLGYAWYSLSVQFCSEGQCLTQFAYTNLHDYFINVYFTQLMLW